MTRSFKEFLKEASENEKINLEDAFWVKDNKITAIKDSEKALAFVPKFKLNNADDWYYAGINNNYSVIEKLQPKIGSLVKTYKKRFGEDTDHGDNATKFSKLGESAAYYQIFNVEYKGQNKATAKVPEKQDENKAIALSLSTLKEKLELLWDINFSENFIENGTVDDLFKEIAKRSAYSDVKKKNESAAEELIETNNGKTVYKEEIKSNAASKNFYLKYYNSYRNSFVSGLNNAGEKIKKGGKIVDPVTQKSYDVDEKKLNWAQKKLAGFADEAGEIAKDLLGLNNKDILSRALNGLIGGKKLSELLANKNKIVFNVPDEAKEIAYNELGKIVHLHSHIGEKNFDDFLNKTKNDVKKASNIFKNVNDKNFIKMQKELGDLAATSLGNAWLHKFAITKNEAFAAYISSNLLLKYLTESADDTSSSISSISSMVETILKSSTVDEFKNRYSDFVKAVNEFIESAKIESDEYLKEKDVYFKFCKIAHNITVNKTDNENSDNANNKNKANELKNDKMVASEDKT